MKTKHLRNMALTTALTGLTAGWAAPVLAEEVTFYSWRVQEQTLWAAISEGGLIDGVTVKFVQIDADNYDTKLRIDLQAGGPDLFQGRAGAAWLAPLIEAGILAPLSGVDLSGIAPAALSAAQGADGTIYGVPFSVQMQSILYNKAVLAANGIEEPASLADLAAAADKLKAAGVVPFSFGGRSGWWLNQVVGEVMTAGLIEDAMAQGLADGTVCFTDPAFVATLTTVKSWQDAGYMNASPMADDYGVMRTSVALGEAAMMIDGVWSSGPASPMYEIDPTLEIGFMPVPGANGKVYAFGDGAYLGNATSAKADAVAKVLAFTATRDFAELFAKHVGELPAYGGEYTVEDPRLAEIASMVASNSSSATPFFANSLNAGEPSYGQLVADGYGALLSGAASPEQVARNIQDGLNSWNYVGAANCP